MVANSQSNVNLTHKYPPSTIHFTKKGGGLKASPLLNHLMLRFFYHHLADAVEGVGAARSCVRLTPIRRAMITRCTSMVPPGWAPARLSRW